MNFLRLASMGGLAFCTMDLALACLANSPTADAFVDPDANVRASRPALGMGGPQRPRPRVPGGLTDVPPPAQNEDGGGAPPSPPSANDAGEGSALGAGPPDAAAGASAGACMPDGVQAFMPLYAPPRFEAACTRDAIDVFFSACLANDATGRGCTQASAGSSSCASCLFTRNTDAAWGATVAYGSSVSVNLAGCLNELGGPDLAGCARALAFQDGCEHAACDAASCTTELTSDACVAEADRGVCKQFADSAAAECPTMLPASVNACTQGSSFEASFTAVAVALCGP